MPQKRIAIKRHSQPLEELLSLARTPALIQQPADVSQFFESLLEATGFAASQLARQVEVAPQTVNRWRHGIAIPRLRQFEKIAEFIESILNPECSESQRETQLSDVSQETLGAISGLGIHFADSVMAMEVEARHVWILKSGPLREANHGFMGESVLQALKNGVHYHYVFLAGTPAEASFARLIDWLRLEEFVGSVTGYCLRDAIWAGSLGITQVPGAWVVIVYGDAQIRRLQRRFDVFMALPAREYTDATRGHIKNEDGLPCWIELATARASTWVGRVHELSSFTPASKKRGISVSRILGRKSSP